MIGLSRSNTQMDLVIYLTMISAPAEISPFLPFVHREQNCSVGPTYSEADAVPLLAHHIMAKRLASTNGKVRAKNEDTTYQEKPII